MDRVNKNQVFGTKYPILFFVFTWERKRASKLSLGDPRSSVGWNSSSQKLKFIALMGYAHIPKMRDFTKDPNEEI